MASQIDFDPSVDYYKALGVSDKASADDIKKAYRKLAKANHPDTTGGDKKKESRFKDISNAYDVLGDEKKRALYEQVRAGGGSGMRGNPFGGGGVYTQQGGGGPNVFDLGDLFGQFFSSATGASTERSRTQRVEVDEDAGVRQRSRDVELESKVRASDGTMLDVKGTDVYSDVRIGFDRAMLGTVATVATVDGKAEVKIPPGTSSGKKLRLRGKGVPDRSGRAGDHYITVEIDVPAIVDDDDKKLLIQLVTRLRKRGQNG